MLPGYLLFILIIISGCSSSKLVLPEITPDIPPGMPQILSAGTLEYLLIARKTGPEGNIYAKVYIDTSGTVRNVEIVDRKFNYAGVYDEGKRRTVYIPEIFDEPLIRFWMETTFIPGVKDGVPVNYRVVIPMQFRLRR